MYHPTPNQKPATSVQFSDKHYDSVKRKERQLVGIHVAFVGLYSITLTIKFRGKIS